MLFRATVLARRFLLGAAILGFAGRAWIPAGYMPAAAADGGPVVLCPGGPGGALIAKLVASRQERHAIGGAGDITQDTPFPASHHHGGHPDGSDDHHSGFDARYCPLGAGAAFAALAPSFDIGLLDLAFSLDAIAAAPIAARAPLRAYESRAPPFI
jgi:hypothetical protein